MIITTVKCDVCSRVIRDQEEKAANGDLHACMECSKMIALMCLEKEDAFACSVLSAVADRRKPIHGVALKTSCSVPDPLDDVSKRIDEEFSHSTRPGFRGLPDEEEDRILKELRDDVDAVREVHKELRRDIDALDDVKEEIMGMREFKPWLTGVVEGQDQRLTDFDKRLDAETSAIRSLESITKQHSSDVSFLSARIGDVAMLLENTRNQLGPLDGLVHGNYKTIKEMLGVIERLKIRVKALDSYPDDVREAVEKVFLMENEVDRLESIDVEGLEEASRLVGETKAELDALRQSIVTIIEAEEEALKVYVHGGVPPQGIEAVRVELAKQRARFKKEKGDG